MPDPGAIDLTLTGDIDLFAPLFRNVDEGHRWSINDIWHQLQEAANPYLALPKMTPPLVRSACFPYPGNVTVDAPEGQLRLGDVIMTVALWWEAEPVWKSAATMVAYGSRNTEGHHRVEFASTQSEKDWAISLQAPAATSDINDLRPGGVWPDDGRQRAGPIDLA